MARHGDRHDNDSYEESCKTSALEPSLESETLTETVLLVNL